MATPDTPTAVLMVLEATFPVLGGGGAESQVMSLGRSLVSRGLQVDVVVPMTANGPPLEHELCANLWVTRIKYPRVRFLGGLVMLFKLAWLLVGRRRNYAVIHAHIGNNMAAVASLVGLALGIPVIVKLTGMKEINGGILDASPGLFNWLKRTAIRQASFVQATSSRIGNLLVARGFDSSRVLLLPNGVDVDRFAAPPDPELRRRLCGSAQLVGLFIGRLAAEKGHEMLLRAWASAFVGRSDVRLLLVGDGPLWQVLHDLAEQLHIDDQVVFAGHADDVSPFIALADLGLLTSHAEGLSNALLEYMAGGLPVVGSRISGTEDFIVPGETGWLFEPGRSDQLAECLALAAAATTSELARLGQAGRQRINVAASLTAVTDQLIDHYGVAKAIETGILPAR
jgi:glycosyltransferase involved in cell wall biosynthesis